MHKDPEVNGEALGHYTALPLRLTTLPLLEGPVISNSNEGCKSWEDLATTMIDVYEAKLNEYSILPITKHLECCEKHEIASASIPTAEAAFIRQIEGYEGLQAHADVGRAYVGICPTFGMTFRVELLDQLYTFEWGALANLVSIISGPIPDGYHISFYVQSVSNAWVFAFEFSLNSKPIKAHPIQVRGFARVLYPEVQPSVMLVRNPIKSDSQHLFENRFDGGSSVQRRSWLFPFKSSSEYFELIKKAISTWSPYLYNSTMHEEFTSCSQAHAGMASITHQFNAYSPLITQLPFQDATGNTFRHYKHQDGLQLTVKSLKRYHADTPWYPFIDVFSNLPFYKRKLPLRFTLCLVHYGGYNFLDKDAIWDVNRDPFSKTTAFHEFPERCKSNNGRMSHSRVSGACLPYNVNAIQGKTFNCTEPSLMEAEASFKPCVRQYKRINVYNPFVRNAEFYDLPESDDDDFSIYNMSNQGHVNKSQYCPSECSKSEGSKANSNQTMSSINRKVMLMKMNENNAHSSRVASNHNSPFNSPVNSKRVQRSRTSSNHLSHHSNVNQLQSHEMEWGDDRSHRSNASVNRRKIDDRSRSLQQERGFTNFRGRRDHSFHPSTTMGSEVQSISGV